MRLLIRMTFVMTFLAGGLLLETPLPTAAVAAPPQTGQAAPSAWTIQSGDRIVLLGNAFIERENMYGQIELALRLGFPDVEFSVRNLGWSGDNVLGESRAYFGPVAAGYAHLQEYVQLLQPTLLLISYGQNEAFEGPDHLPGFLERYGKLLNDLKADGRRIVVLGLAPLEPVHRDPAAVEKLNADRQLFNAGIQELCVARQLPFVDLFEPVLELQSQLRLSQLTENGVIPSRDGYAVIGEVLLNQLGKSLRRGPELLLLDSQFQAATAPVTEQLVWKNELFFHRFRPQNETYLRGFRKHEQGQNAKEIYEFDALVEQAEQKLQPAVRELMQQWTPGPPQ